MTFKKYLRVSTAVLSAALALFVFTAYSKTAENSFSAPDFAFPKEVESNARVVLSNAHSLPIEKCVAVYQIAHAQLAVDNTQPQRQLLLLDSLSATLSQPYVALLTSLKVQMLADIYSANPYIYNNRTLPDNQRSENPRQWSGKQFHECINQLNDSILAMVDRVGVIPISEIGSMLGGDPAQYELVVPDVATFLRLQVLQTARRLPKIPTIPIYGNTAAEVPDIEFENPYTKVYAAVNYHDLTFDETLRLYEQLKEHPASLLLLEKMEGYASEQAEVYKLAKEALQRHPDSPFTPNVKNLIAKIEQISVDVSVREQVASTQPVAVDLKIQNCRQAYLLLLKLPTNSNGRTQSNAFEKATLISATPFSVDKEVPFAHNQSLTIANPGYGVYALAVSKTRSKAGILDKKRFIAEFRVSDLMIATAINNENADNFLFVTEATHFAPIKGAQVIIDPSKGKSYSKYTDANGVVDLPLGRSSISAVKGKDILLADTYTYKNSPHSELTSLHAQIFADRGIYHPGDTISFAVVAYTKTADRKLAIASGERLRFMLKDANYKTVSQSVATTDKDGRFSAQFVIPDDALLGRWSVLVEDMNGQALMQNGLQVAQYKSPTIYAEITSLTVENDTIKACGAVRSYAGQNVANADVAYTLRYRGWWRNWQNNGATYTDNLFTDANGAFSISLPIGTLKNTAFAKGSYQLSLLATAPDGAVTNAAVRTFALGSDCRLDIGKVADKYLIDGDSLTLQIPVCDILDNPIAQLVKYTLTGNGEILSRGSFTAPELTLATAQLPSGEYTLSLELENGEKANVETVFYRHAEARVPSSLPLWVPTTDYVAKRGQKSLKICLGTPRDGQYVLCQISDCNDVIDRYWIRSSGQMQSIEVPAPAANQQIKVDFLTAHNFNISKQTVNIIPEEQNVQLNIDILAMQDTIQPGGRDKWSLRVSEKGGGAASRIPMLAVLTNKALDQLAPFNWQFTPQDYIYYPSAGTIRFHSVGTSIDRFINPIDFLKPYDLATPQWRYRKDRGANRPRIYAKAQRADGANMETKMVADSFMATEEAAAETTFAGNADGNSPEDAELLVDLPVGLFLTNLNTDSDGRLDIDFTAPLFDTEWKLQLLAYNRDLLTATRCVPLFTQSPISIKTNVPRFLRHGDKLSLQSSVFNNTDVPQEVCFISTHKGVTNTRMADISAGQSTRFLTDVTALFDARDGGAKARWQLAAKTPDFSVKQSAEIEILPATTPILKSTEFRLGNMMKDFAVTLPDYPEQASVSLYICQNAIWQCLTALPDLAVPSGNSTFQRADALFSNVVAAHIIKAYPQAADSLVRWKNDADPILLSKLETNSDLKSVALKKTPWVADAEAQSLRRQNLLLLLDERRYKAEMSRLSQQLLSRQKSDGAWSWTPQMNGSLYATMRVLRSLAMLHQIDAFPNGFNAAVGKAVAYADSQIAEAMRRNGGEFPIADAVQFLYTTTAFQLNTPLKGAKSRHTASLTKVIARHWRELPFPLQAQAAAVLTRAGKIDEARLVMKSVLQRGSLTEQGDLYFANLSTDAVSTTADVLIALNEVDPSDHNVGRLVQWLLAQLQTQEWKNNANTAKSVLAILSANPQWTDVDASAVVKIDDTIIDAKRPLEAKKIAGKTLCVSTSGQQPVWGALVAQYVDDIENVQPQNSDYLKIQKSLFPIDSNDFEIGDKIRVQFTITATQDLQYVVLTDQRAASLEPIDQLSQYMVQDGVYIYREVDNSDANMLIENLPRGVYHFYYDCIATHAGSFASGIASAQSLIAPHITAFSNASKIYISAK